VGATRAIITMRGAIWELTRTGPWLGFLSVTEPPLSFRPTPRGYAAIDGVRKAPAAASDSRVRRKVFELHRCVALRVVAADT
jgi:hypothetical protein